MGNSALKQLVAIEEQQLIGHQGQTVAVDAHHWLHRYINKNLKRFPRF
jgi:hypothetical protein